MNLKLIDKQGQGAVVPDAALAAFAESRSADGYFPAASHAAALAALGSMLELGHSSFAMLAAAPGSGKTLMRTLLNRSLDPARFVRVSIENSLLDFDALLLEIISQINGRRATARELPDRYARLSELKRLLSTRVVQPGRRLVILMDEAQGYSAETLERIRLLSNISTEQAGIMSFVLFGDHGLVHKVEELPALNQRVMPRPALAPFSTEEIRGYVQHRLHSSASGVSAAFSDGGWRRLAHASEGVPRRINQAMQQALTAARSTQLDDTCLDSITDQQADAFTDPSLLG